MGDEWFFGQYLIIVIFIEKKGGCVLVDYFLVAEYLNFYISEKTGGRSTFFVLKNLFDYYCVMDRINAAFERLCFQLRPNKNKLLFKCL